MNATPINTGSGRITMTRARSQLGITMKVLRRLLAKHNLEVDMLHRNCALMTLKQFEKIVEAYLLEQRDLLNSTRNTILKLEAIHDAAFARTAVAS